MFWKQANTLFEEPLRQTLRARTTTPHQTTPLLSHRTEMGKKSKSEEAPVADIEMADEPKETKEERRARKEAKKADKKRKRDGASSDSDAGKEKDKDRKKKKKADDESPEAPKDKRLSALKEPTPLRDYPSPAPSRDTPSPAPGDKPEKAKKTEDAENETPEELRLSSYRLSPSTINSLTSRGIKALFPIQAKTFDPIFDGKDLLGRARTGTGKTLAFSLPIVERLLRDNKERGIGKHKRGRKPRALIMAPTRELALQVAKEMENCAGEEIATLSVYGGTEYNAQSGCWNDQLLFRLKTHLLSNLFTSNHFPCRRCIPQRC